MQISTKFTIAIHILIATEYFGGEMKVTSDLLSKSIGSNPVIIRNIMSQLRNSKIIDVKRGPGGIFLTRDLSEISFLDVYKSVETSSSENLFKFHDNPNPSCPVGRYIHLGLDDHLKEIQKKLEDELSSHNLYEVYEKTLKEIQK